MNDEYKSWFERFNQEYNCNFTGDRNFITEFDIESITKLYEGIGLDISDLVGKRKSTDIKLDDDLFEM